MTNLKRIVGSFMMVATLSACAAGKGQDSSTGANGQAFVRFKLLIVAAVIIKSRHYFFRSFRKIKIRPNCFSMVLAARNFRSKLRRPAMIFQ